MTVARVSTVLSEVMTVEKPSTGRVSSVRGEAMTKAPSAVRLSFIRGEVMVPLYPPDVPSGMDGFKVGGSTPSALAVGSTPIIRVMLGETELWAAE